MPAAQTARRSLSPPRPQDQRQPHTGLGSVAEDSSIEGLHRAMRYLEGDIERTTSTAEEADSLANDNSQRLNRILARLVSLEQSHAALRANRKRPLPGNEEAREHSQQLSKKKQKRPKHAPATPGRPRGPDDPEEPPSGIV